MRRSETHFTARTASSLAALLLLLAAFLLPARAFAAAPRDEDLATLRLQFQQQTDAVKRAKLFSKFGAALMAEMRKLQAAKDYEKVTPLFLEYRDAASTAFKGLTEANPDAEKHPGGYRELEMHLRQSLHLLNNIVFDMPLDDRESLLGPQREIEKIDDRLVKALFPRGPQARSMPLTTASWQPRG